MRISDWSSDVCSSDLLGDLAEGPYGLRERDVDALVAGELLGHVEGLGEELLDLPRPGHGDLVVLRELVHAEARDDVLEVLVALEAGLDLPRHAVVLLAHDGRVADAGGERTRGEEGERVAEGGDAGG